MRKKAIYVTVLLAVLAVALTIPNITLSKYVSDSTNFDMTFSSAPFYFDAEIDSKHNYHGPSTVLMDYAKVDITINVRNYIGTKVTDQDIQYSIALKESDQINFTLEETERTLVYDGAQVDSVTLKLSLNYNATVSVLEYITILVVSNKPFAQTVELTLGVYTQLYQEYDLNYEIHLGDEVISTADEDYVFKNLEGNTIDSIFGSGRLTKIENYSFYFTVTIPNNYTATVYWNGEKINVNGKWDLGVEPVYEFIDGKIQPNTDKGPSSLLLEYTGYLNNASQDFTISVYLTNKFTEENQKVPVFDAREWLTKAPGAIDRGSTGIDHGPDYVVFPGVAPGNLETLDNWYWSTGGTLYNTAQPMTLQDDGTYSFEWTFQTNNNDGGYLLDALQINGYNIKIPFAPGVSVSKWGVVTEHPNADHTKTTVLPDGTEITIEYVRDFNDALQRVYKVTVSNALSDVTVTDGNLKFLRASEIAVYSLVGIANNEITIDSVAGELKYSQSTVIYQLDGIYAFRFKLQDYYHKPAVKITDIYGNVIQTYTATVNNDGFYVVSDFYPDAMTNITPGLLYIEAEPMQFAIRYDKGDVDDATWDNSDTPWFDDNGGNYYSVDRTKLISIIGLMPKDPREEMHFVYWKIGFVKIQVGQIFVFSELVQYAVENEEGIFVITLEAIWEV